MCSFSFFKQTLLFLSLYFYAQAQDTDVDKYDQICADHMVMVFQAYTQSKQGLEIDLQKRVTTSSKFLGIIPYQITRGPINEDLLDGWIFKPIYGQTGFNFSHIKYLKKSLLGMVGYHERDNIITITYRGTQQLSDWWHNMKCSRRKIPYIEENILVHSGYLDVFESSLTSLKETLDEMTSKMVPEEVRKMHVLVTGHSLGGSTASIAVAFLRNYFPDSTMRLSIFGAPLIGKKNYNEWLEKNNIRTKSFVRQTDPAPYNPSGYGCCFLGQYIALPHYGAYMLMWPIPHLNNKYRLGVYEKIGQEACEDLAALTICGMSLGL